MVGFAQSEYKFGGEQAENWFRLLNKYLNGVEVTIKIGKRSYGGELNEAWLNELGLLAPPQSSSPQSTLSSLSPPSTASQLPSSLALSSSLALPSLASPVSSLTSNKSLCAETKKSYTVTTDRFWSEKCAIAALPKFSDSEVCTPESEHLVKIKSSLDLSTPLPSAVADIITNYFKADENIKKIAKNIDSVIAGRLEMEGNEVFIRRSLDKESKYSPRKYSPSKNSKVVITWDDITSALRFLNNKENITRCIILPHSQVAYLVLNDRYTITITKSRVSDGTLPTLDFDDGFEIDSSSSSSLYGRSEDTKLIEFKLAFQEWKNKFNKSKGATWNEPIFTSCVVDCTGKFSFRGDENDNNNDNSNDNNDNNLEKNSDNSKKRKRRENMNDENYGGDDSDGRDVSDEDQDQE